MKRAGLLLTQICIAILLVGTLLMQIFGVFEIARSSAEQLPEATHLVVPYGIAAILGLVCVQVLLGGVGFLCWRLQRPGPPADSTLITLRVMRYAALSGGLLSMLVAAHLIFIENLGGTTYMFVAGIGLGFGLVAAALHATSGVIAKTRDYYAELSQVV